MSLSKILGLAYGGVRRARVDLGYKANSPDEFLTKLAIAFINRR